MAAINFSLDGLTNADDETQWRAVPFTQFASAMRTKLKDSQWLSAIPTSIPQDITAPEYMTFHVLREFLQPTSSLSTKEAIQCLLEIFPQGQVEDAAIVVVSLDMAKQIPYQHTAHAKLARLLWSYGRNTARLDQGGWNHDALQGFCSTINGDLTYRGLQPRDGDPEYPPDQYVNYLAFVAHVHAVGIFRPWSGIAAHLISSGLNSKHEADSSAVRDAWVLGAAQLILWYGQGLFELVLLPEEPEHDDAVPSWLADQPDERGPLSLKLWRLWRERFVDVSESSDYGTECRNVAKKAADIMDVLSRSMRL